MIQLKLLKRFFEPFLFLNTDNYKLLVCDLEQDVYEQGNLVFFLFFFCFCEVVKKLCNCLCHCFSFSSCRQCFWTTPQVFFVRLIVVVCTCGSILPHTWGKLCGERSIDLKRFAREYYMTCALEKIMMAEASCSICKTVYEEVICDTCDPWYVVCLSLFTVNSYHSVQRV